MKYISWKRGFNQIPSVIQLLFLFFTDVSHHVTVTQKVGNPTCNQELTVQSCSYPDACQSWISIWYWLTGNDAQILQRSGNVSNLSGMATMPQILANRHMLMHYRRMHLQHYKKKLNGSYTGMDLIKFKMPGPFQHWAAFSSSSQAPTTWHDNHSILHCQLHHYVNSAYNSKQSSTLQKLSCNKLAATNLFKMVTLSH